MTPEREAELRRLFKECGWASMGVPDWAFLEALDVLDAAERELADWRQDHALHVAVGFRPDVEELRFREVTKERDTLRARVAALEAAHKDLRAKLDCFALCGHHVDNMEVAADGTCYCGACKALILVPILRARVAALEKARDTVLPVEPPALSVLYSYRKSLREDFDAIVARALEGKHAHS